MSLEPKHTAEPYERIFFRGERKLYGRLSPTAYRDVSTVGGQAKRHAAINDLLSKFRTTCSISQRFNERAHEPLLQHYGVKTTWIDLVDNVWIALWFSVYQALSVADGRFLHFDQRQPNSSEEYCYILMIAVESGEKAKVKGFMIGRNTETVDLRIAAPSVFVRPHAQHGLLFRPLARTVREQGLVRPLDYSKHVRGVVRFKLTDAIRWLGTGEMHSVRALFPPPFHDSGYGILLSAHLEDPALGAIHHVGA